jgi:cytochrome c oxidase assembly protein subunit 15
MPSIFQTLPLLRRAAPRLSKQFFTCQGPPRIRPQTVAKSPKLYALLRAFRYSAKRTSVTKVLENQTPLSLSELSQNFGHAKSRAYFPQTSEKVVAYWLLGSAASVFGLIIFGGLTRLTESG